MSPRGLNTVSAAWRQPPISASCCPAGEDAHLHAWGGKERMQISLQIHSQKRPLRKSMFHIARVGWNNNLNLNPAEPQRVMNYFLVVMKAIKKNKQFTSGLKLTTQGTSVTERYVGAQVRKHWEACTSWWLHVTQDHLPPHPMMCQPEHRTVQLKGRVSLSWTETSLHPFQRIWVLLGYQPISTTISPTFITHVSAMLLLNQPKTVLVWTLASCTTGIFTSLRKPYAMHFSLKIREVKFAR